MAHGAAFFAFGTVAGVLTSLAGQGGGLFLVLVMSSFAGPHAALGATAPALLVGNAHRAFLLRRSIAWPVARPVLLGAVPGSVLGGLLVGLLPGYVLRGLLVTVTVVTLARAAGLVSYRPGPRALTPAGFVIGGLAAAAGGAGILLGPVLLACDLTGAAYVGTSSLVAFALHAGRIVAYGHGGLFTAPVLAQAAVLAVAIPMGNTLAEPLRRRLSKRATRGLEYGALTLCSALAVSGIAG